MRFHQDAQLYSGVLHRVGCLSSDSRFDRSTVDFLCAVALALSRPQVGRTRFLRLLYPLQGQEVKNFGECVGAELDAEAKINDKKKGQRRLLR